MPLNGIRGFKILCGCIIIQLNVNTYSFQSRLKKYVGPLEFIFNTTNLDIKVAPLYRKTYKL